MPFILNSLSLVCLIFHFPIAKCFVGVIFSTKRTVLYFRNPDHASTSSCFRLATAMLNPKLKKKKTYCEELTFIYIAACEHYRQIHFRIKDIHYPYLSHNHIRIYECPGRCRIVYWILFP